MHYYTYMTNKVLGRTNRIQEEVDSSLRKEQAVFKAGIGKNIFTCIERIRKYQRDNCE